MRKLPVFLAGCLLFHGVASAGMLMEFSLSDGKSVRGRIESQDSGVYTVRTDKGEKLLLPESKVKAVRLFDGGGDAASVPREEALRDAGALQGAMMHDDAIMEILRSLSGEPEMQRLLSDPDVMAAVASGDLSALARSPKVKALLENPKVREIERRVTAPKPPN